MKGLFRIIGNHPALSDHSKKCILGGIKIILRFSHINANPRREFGL